MALTRPEACHGLCLSSLSTNPAQFWQSSLALLHDTQNSKDRPRRPARPDQQGRDLGEGTLVHDSVHGGEFLLSMLW